MVVQNYHKRTNFGLRRMTGKIFRLEQQEIISNTCQEESPQQRNLTPLGSIIFQTFLHYRERLRKSASKSKVPSISYLADKVEESKVRCTHFRCLSFSDRSTSILLLLEFSAFCKLGFRWNLAQG